MNEKFFLRLKQIIDFHGLSNNRFAEKIGVSSAQMSHMLNGKNFGVSNLLNIISAVPDINGDWLLSGEGELLKQPLSDKQSESVIVAHLKEQLKELKDENKALNREIGKLELELKQIKNKLPYNIAAEP